LFFEGGASDFRQFPSPNGDLLSQGQIPQKNKNFAKKKYSKFDEHLAEKSFFKNLPFYTMIE
jgi:hypothetical protein